MAGKRPDNTYDAATFAGIRDVAGPLQATVDPLYAGFDPPTQLTQCHQAVISGLYDGLFVEAADGVAIEPCVAEAKKHNIPVVATDLPIGPDANNLQPQVPGEVGASFLPAFQWGNAVKTVTPQVCQGLNPCNILYIAGELSLSFDQLGIQGVKDAAGRGGPCQESRCRRNPERPPSAALPPREVHHDDRTSQNSFRKAPAG